MDEVGAIGRSGVVRATVLRKIRSLFLKDAVLWHRLASMSGRYVKCVITLLTKQKAVQRRLRYYTTV